jgi:hypothetical protein
MSRHTHITGRLNQKPSGRISRLWDTRGNGRDLQFADGRKLFVGSSGTGAPDERPEK